MNHSCSITKFFPKWQTKENLNIIFRFGQPFCCIRFLQEAVTTFINHNSPLKYILISMTVDISVILGLTRYDYEILGENFSFVMKLVTKYNRLLKIFRRFHGEVLQR